MRFAISLTLLCLATAFRAHPSYADSAPKNPHWIPFSVDYSSVSYIDLNHIQRTYKDEEGAQNVATAIAWVVINFPWQESNGCQRYPNGQSYCPTQNSAAGFSSVIWEVKFDCMNNRSTELRAISFRGHMGQGKVVDDSSLPTKWVTDKGSNSQWESLACYGFPYGYLQGVKQP